MISASKRLRIVVPLALLLIFFLLFVTLGSVKDSLLVFTGITVGLSYVDFGSSTANIVIALIVATFKAGLVAAIFMHLSAEKWTIYRILLFTVFFAIGLFALTWLAYIDPITL